VIAAGGVVRGGTEVLAISGRDRTGGVEVTTLAGTIRARDVIVATNGYTPRQFGWHARRVIPFTGYMAATEIIPEVLRRRAISNNRTVIDTNTNIDFFRWAPDQSRILFGGATGSGLTGPDAIAGQLHGILSRTLPDLAAVKLSRVWTGQCAGTFDMMPHMGQSDGIWYGMGYNFAGVPMGSYFGMKLAAKIIGDKAGDSIFEADPFDTKPFYRGNPWFVPAAMRYFDWKDRRLARRRA
jgi:glycine/D-amino acid oxidase-like deaminating enzyme